MREGFKTLPEQPAKYEAGKLVVINGMMMGMVLSSFWEYNDRHYRLFVDANEIAYRMRNKHFEQQDYFLFKEDIDQFLWHTQGVVVISAMEKELTEIEYWLKKGEESENEQD